MAVFLFLGAAVFLYIKARQGPGPFLIATIFGCIALDISFTTAVLYPYALYRVITLHFNIAWFASDHCDVPDRSSHCSPTSLPLCDRVTSLNPHLPLFRFIPIHARIPRRCRPPFRHILTPPQNSLHLYLITRIFTQSRHRQYASS